MKTIAERIQELREQPAEEQTLLAWFTEVRALLGELPSIVPAEEMDITLVGRGDFFGARCASFAATGATPVVAMTRLRDKLREAVEKRRGKDTEPSPPPSLRTG